MICLFFFPNEFIFIWQENPCKRKAAMNKTNCGISAHSIPPLFLGILRLVGLGQGEVAPGVMLEVVGPPSSSFMDLATCPEGQPVYPDIV